MAARRQRQGSKPPRQRRRGRGSAPEPRTWPDRRRRDARAREKTPSEPIPVLRARVQQAHLRWRSLASSGADLATVQRAEDELERAMAALRRAEEQSGGGR